MTSPRILYIDIETAPVLAWIWRTGKQYVNASQIKAGQKSGIIVICYKWAHEKTVHALNWGLHEQNSEKMIEEISRILETADVVLAHNGDSFDIKHINTQRLLNNQPPIAWPTSEDTLKQVRKHFYFPSYSLDYLAKTLTGSGKDRMEFADWIDIVENKDPRALKKMISYCKRDVLKLEEIWRRIAPYCKVKANIALPNTDNCPRCSSKHRQSRGLIRLAAGIYRRYRCQNCGHTWRASKRLPNE